MFPKTAPPLWAAALLAAAVGRAAAAATVARDGGASSPAGGGHTGPDGQQTCLDGQPCCAFDPTEYGCCDGGGTEACCADDQGGVCCVSQPTVCVPKGADGGGYPARCCPRETVGCGAGTVGCCNPARAWQRGPPLNPPSAAAAAAAASSSSSSAFAEDVVNSARARRPRQLLSDSRGPTPAVTRVPLDDINAQIKAFQNRDTGADAGDPHVAFVLAVGGSLFNPGNLIALTVNTTSGATLNKVSVPGYNNWGESTRDFAFDPKRKLFYALDVNFTGTGATRPAGGRPITLSKIDPATGATTHVAVTGGPTDYVSGYAYHSASGRLHCAADAYDGDKVTGSTFFYVDPDTGKAEVLGTLARSGQEDDPSTYGGFHRAVSDDGGKAFRLGYRSVVSQAGPGLGAVHLPSADAAAEPSADWTSMAAVDEAHEFYLGMLSLGGDKVASIAPQSATGFLDLVLWDLPSLTSETMTTPTVVNLGNVTGPGVVMGKQGTLGFVLDAARASDGQYVALVSIPNPTPIPYPGALDAWGIAKVDVATGKATVTPLVPGILTGGTSISGVGLPSV